MAVMAELADPAKVHTLIDRLSERIAEVIDRHSASGQAGRWALVGIRSRGDIIARRLAERLGEARLSEPVGSLDITLYRDDLGSSGAQPRVRTTDIPFAIDRTNLVLVDDVLMTGRSARAAMQGLIDFGRPRRIWLAAMVDRGGRELPICPDFVAMNLVDAMHAPPADQAVRVMLEPGDERDAIVTEEPESER